MAGTPTPDDPLVKKTSISDGGSSGGDINKFSSAYIDDGKGNYYDTTTGKKLEGFTPSDSGKKTSSLNGGDKSVSSWVESAQKKRDEAAKEAEAARKVQQERQKEYGEAWHEWANAQGADKEAAWKKLQEADKDRTAINRLVLADDAKLVQAETDLAASKTRSWMDNAWTWMSDKWNGASKWTTDQWNGFVGEIKAEDEEARKEVDKELAKS